MLAYLLRRAEREVAFDAAEDVFLVARRRLSEVPPDDRALAWLYGVARKVLANHRRSAARFGRLAQRLAAQLPDLPAGPEAESIAHLEAEAMLRALSTLPERDQEVLRLTYWEELPHAEIAPLIGCSIEAVHVRRYRAERRLANSSGPSRTQTQWKIGRPSGSKGRGMLSERDIGKALGLANPVPDPEHAVTESEANALFAAISRRSAAGTPVMAGDCGLLRLDGDEFDVVNGEVAPHYGTVTAVAVGSDGTAWIAGPLDPLRSVTDGVATEHPFEATDVAVTTDGTVWAVRYDHPPGLSSLWKLEGGVFVEPDSGPFAVRDEELVAASDGSLLMLAWEAVDYDPVAEAAAEWRLHIGKMHGGVYTQTPLPDGFEGDHLALAEGRTAYAIFPTGRRIERGGYFGEWALYRFDGGEVSTMIIPFPEPNDVVVHPNGVVWVTSSLYGAFAYDGEEWVRYSTEQGLPDDEATFVEMAPDGSIYIGTRLGVTRISAELD